MDSSDVVSRLRAAGCVFAEEEAELLLAEARSPQALDAMVADRVGGTPLEHVLGWAEFCGLRIAVEPGVFVPRYRSEFLVQCAAALAPPSPVVVELCCGSGALARALAALLPAADIHASDLDAAAVGCARGNLEPVGAQVYQGDLYAALPARLQGRVDLLVANAPYVPTDEIRLMPSEARDHEPLLALDGGSAGVDVHRRIAAEASRWLAPGGHLLVETSSRQAPLTVDAFIRGGLTAQVKHDEDADATIVIGRRATGSFRPSGR